MLIKDQVVVITGAASGIGAALARAVAAQGAKLCLSDRDAERLSAIAAELDAVSCVADVAREDEVRALVRHARDALGQIDVFVSNAGFGRGQPGSAASASNDIWQMNWDVHVMAHVYAARALLPDMIERGSGYFVNVASAAGLLNQIGDAAYSATKNAAVSFAESLSISHAADGIGVSVVCPQYVATPLLGLDDNDAAQRETLLTADDVALCILDGIKAGQFRILTHPQVSEYVTLRASDPERWLAGMRALKAKAEKTFGSADAASLYKLV